MGIQASTGVDFVLSLHGFFFVDAGRNRIDLGEASTAGDPEDEKAVRSEWNRQLYHRGTLPLVLPALHQFCSDAGLSDDQIAALTEALHEWYEKAGVATHVCSEHNWLYRLTPDGVNWSLAKSSGPFWVLPEPPESRPNLHFEVFPKLHELAAEHVLTFADRPRLTSAANAVWDECLLLRLLDFHPAEVFQNRGQLEYLARFIDLCVSEEERLPEAVIDRLCSIIREAFAQIDLSRLYRNAPQLRQIFAHLGSRVLGIDIGDQSDVRRGFVDMLGLDTELLLVPRDLLPDDHTQPMPASQEATSILATLSHLVTLPEHGVHFDRQRTAVAMDVLNATRDRKQEVLSLCADTRLFWGQGLRSHAARLFSYTELGASRAQGLLFRLPYPKSASRVLQQCLASDEVIEVQDTVASCLFGEGQVPVCDRRPCVQALLARPTLTPRPARIGLLEVLVGSWDRSDDFGLAVRYLMHGHKEDTGQDLLAASAGDGQTAWAKLGEQILDLQGCQWRMVSRDLTDLLPQRHWKEIGLGELNEECALRLLDEVDPGTLDGSNFSQEERSVLLRGVRDPAVLRRLPIHEAMDGDLVTIDDQTYLEGGFPLPGRLQTRVTLLRRSSDPLVEQRQRQLVPEVAPEVAISLAIGEHDPESFWETILDALAALDRAGTVPEELKQQLVATEWLPTAEQGRASPGEVIHLEGIEDDVDRIVSATHGAFIGVNSLAPQVREHRGGRTLQKLCFPSVKDAFAVLGAAMGDDPASLVGPLDLEQFELEDFLVAFSGDPEQVMPVTPFLERVSQKPRLRDHVPSLLAELTRPLGPGRLISILNYLTGKCEQRPAGVKRTLTVHRWYLAVASQSGDFSEILPEIRLLSRRGNWKSPRTICFNADGIDDDYLLDTEQAKIVRERVARLGDETCISAQTGVETPPAHEHESTEDLLAEAVSQLREYFRAWQGVVASQELIGAFLCILGDDPAMRELAESYLGNRSIENTREGFEWQPIANPDVGGYGKSLQDVMSYYRFAVEVTKGESYRVPSLTGDYFDAPLRGENLENLLLGGLWAQVTPDKYVVRRLQLRSLPPGTCSPDEFARLLKESLRAILRRVFCQRAACLDDFWEELSHTEQFDIQIAQHFILTNAFFYLRQLDFRSRSRINGLLKRWDDACHRQVEEEELLKSGKTPEMAAFKAQRQLREELRTFLLDHKDIQLEIHRAIKEKMSGHYHYTPESVPFEIFQNADDAALELEEMVAEDGDELSSHVGRFALRWDVDVVEFARWGRTINKDRHGTVNRGDRGFDRDLAKMLIFSSSDKSTNSGGLEMTGKFGLGFKTVYQVSNRPKVVSGRLGFEVLAGLYPERLYAEFADLNARLKELELGEAKTGGTLFSLPITEEVTADEVVSRFLGLAHILLAFSRKIRACDVHSPSGKTEPLLWNETPVMGVANVGVGILRPATHSGQSSSYAMVLRASGGGLLISLGSNGAKRLPKEVPTVWVTTPTKEEEDLGFAVNGRFALNIGRTQLAPNSEENQRLARSIGKGIGEALCSLCQASEEDWDGFVDGLRLSRGTTAVTFWESMWEVLASAVAQREPVGDAGILVRAILWADSETGMAKLVTSHRVTPSGLFGEYRGLVDLQRVAHVVTGALDQEEHFQQVAEWDFFRERAKPGEVISASRTQEVLRRLLPSVLHSMPVDLRRVLGWALEYGREVPAERATQLGTLINPEFLSGIETGAESERRELRDALTELQFRTRNGHYEPTEGLLVAHSEHRNYQDEALRAAFAPEDSILAEDYRDDALQFFRACRDRRRVSAQDMALWGLSAADDVRRRGLLRYLLEGELGRQVAAEMREMLDGTWIANLPQLDIFSEFDDNEKSQLLGLLGLAGRAEEPERRVRRDTGDILEDIYQWWTEGGNAWVRVYEGKIYPRRAPPAISFDFVAQDAENRQNWLILMLLGCTHSIGRTTFEQHRSFLRLCINRGWLAVFSEPAIDGERWIALLREYLEDQVQGIPFFHWLKLFPSAFQLGNWLNEYVEAFGQIDRLTREFAIDQITCPRASALFRGGGPDAPDLRPILGEVGRAFVMRELVRLGLVRNTHAHVHCFVPSGRVRRVLNAAGLVSAAGDEPPPPPAVFRELASHLGNQRATFDLSFDLPFLAVAENEALQARFFREPLPEDEEGNPWED